MASMQQIKRRTKSVKNTRQITRAMELVAASKMRRAQQQASQSQLYAEAADKILNRLSRMTNVSAHPLFCESKLETRLIVVITSARGLAGAYDSNVIRYLLSEIQADRDARVNTKVLSIGKKGANLLSRIQDIEVIGAYDELPENPTGNDVKPIVTTIINEFKDAKVQAVDIIYTHYINSIKQEPKVFSLLPAAVGAEEVDTNLQDVLFEPSPKLVLDRITEHLVEIQLVQTFLEAFASEQSMRMMAMQNATDNAGEIIDDLTLEYNSARQAAITQELAEITAGAGALS